LLRILWTFLALASSLPVLADTLGSAAWNGVNFVVCLYLIASAGGSIGLLAGFYSAFSHGRVLKWITCVAALAVVSVSAIYAAGFVFGRTAGVPLSDPMYFGSFHAPTLLLYAIAIFCCLVEALLYLPGHGTREVR
jgi:ABC-type branched-subunit amino acid transport system permease subunit